MNAIVPERRAPDWGLPDRPNEPGPTIALGVASLVAIAVAVFVALTAGPIPGALAGIVLIGALAAWIASSARRALRRSRAVRVPEGDQPRLRNIATGLAGELGIPAPSLFVIGAGGPNALVVPGSTPKLAVTKTLLDSYTLTEIEAVVAHCLARIASGDARRDVRAIAALGIGASLIGLHEDVRASAITRYPPALASAVGKAEARPGRLWFVGDDRTHESTQARVQRLNEL